MPANLTHQYFTHRGETASYQVRDGWMTVDWGGARAGPHELKNTPENLLAQMLLVQMPAWLKKYPEDGIPAASSGAMMPLDGRA